MADDHKKVGYKNPPKHSQFKKGRSGNPKGRPKGTKNLKTDLMEELSESVRVREGDHEYRVSKQRAVLKAVVAAAVRGNVSAATVLVGLYTRFVGAGDEAGEQGPAETDRQILEEYVEREIKRRSTAK